MKRKITKISIVTALLMAVLFAFTGCATSGGGLFDGIKDWWGGLFSHDGEYVLSLSKDTGVSFSKGNSVYLAPDKGLPLIKNTKTTLDVGGFYDYENPSTFYRYLASPLHTRMKDHTLGSVDVNAFLMPSKDTILSPFFVQKGYRPLIPASQTIDTNSSFVQRGDVGFYETNLGTQIGVDFTYSGNLYSPALGTALSGSAGYFRMQTSCSTDKNSFGAIGLGTHVFSYWVKNLGDKPFTISLLQGYDALKFVKNDEFTQVEVAAGKSYNFSIELTITGANSFNINSNALTLVAFHTNHTVDKAKFAVVMSKDIASDVS